LGSFAGCIPLHRVCVSARSRPVVRLLQGHGSARPRPAFISNSLEFHCADLPGNDGRVGDANFAVPQTDAGGHQFPLQVSPPESGEEGKSCGPYFYHFVRGHHVVVLR